MTTHNNPPTKSKDRRRFLLGAGGAALALPLLPSLFTPNEVKAQTRQLKCFAAFWTPYGGVGNRDMYPAASTLTQNMTYAGYQIRRGNLALTNVGGEVQMSNICRAPASDLTAALAAKANIIHGVDIPFWIDHNNGGSMGNWGDTNIGDRFPPTNFITRTQTIDQIIGWSPNFYSDTTLMRERVMVVNEISYAHADPRARTGPISRVSSTARGSRELFDKLFGTNTAPAKPLVVDQVLESYKQLRDGNSRLSADDKRRLDEHMQRIAELQRKLRAAAPPAPPARPAKSSSQLDTQSNFNTASAPQVEFYQLYNEVIAAAFSTGASRVASIGTYGWEFGTFKHGIFADFGGDWHNDISHQYRYAGAAYDQLAAGNRRFFARVQLDLAKRLDAINTGDGKTLLDHSLVVWHQECGNRTHLGINMPIVAFGSAGGFLHTGQYLDYRNLSKKLYDANDAETSHHGLVWNQWMATILQSMGLQPSEYETAGGAKGYPRWRTRDEHIIEWTRYNGYNGVTEQAYPDAVWNVAGDVLPWMKA
jgi:hypothetical protein